MLHEPKKQDAILKHLHICIMTFSMKDRLQCKYFQSILQYTRILCDQYLHLSLKLKLNLAN